MTKTVFLLCILGVLCMCLFVTFAGYTTGYDKAEAHGKAALAALGKTLAMENALRWQAYATAEREARERLQAEVARADSIAADLHQAETTLAAQQQDVTQRIAHATRDTTCTFSPEFVRLYNEALYGTAPGTAGAATSTSTRGAAPAAHPASTPAPAGGRVLRPVTAADILAHARDYGAYSRTLLLRLAAWQDLAEW